MRKFFGLLLLLSLTQVGIAYAGTDASNTPVANRDYIFGLSKSSTVNLNQVLFLLAGKDGKDGKDGIAGIAGKDGIDGINGVNGTNGINGVDGRNGLDGTNGKDGVNGRDGRDGRDGAQGPAGPAGPPGSGGSGSISDLRYGAAAVLTAACTDSATVGLKALFTGDDFVFDYVTLKDVDTACGVPNRKFAFYLKINAAPASVSPKASDVYRNSEVIKCIFDVPLASTWGSAPQVQFTLSGTASVCTNLNRSVPAFRLNDISTADYYRAIGFEIYRE